MELKLTTEQLAELKKELILEKERLNTIPSDGSSWELIDCRANIHTLKVLIKKEKIHVYNII